MNLFNQKVKQYFQNNLLHEENSREHNSRKFIRTLYKSVPRAVALVEPDYSRTWGIDISHWDGLVDLSVTKSKGASFVFIKGLDGALQTKYFPENRQTAINVGLPHAPYGWLYANKNVICALQAQAYDVLCNKYPPVLTPVLDFEWTYYGGVRSDPNFTDLEKWATEWLRLGNPKAILYSAAGFMNLYGQIPGYIKDMFAGIWIANYGAVNPLMPLGYAPDEWLYHQFASTGNQEILAPSGSGKKELDLNYAGKAVLPPPTGGNMFYKCIKEVAIRNGTNYPDPAGVIGKLAVGDVVEGVLLTNVNNAITRWIHFSKVWRATGEIETFDGYCSGYTTYMVETTDPNPPEPTPAGPPTLTIHVHGNGVYPDTDIDIKPL